MSRMVWIDDEDVCNILAHLLEAKGSIGAMINFAGDKQAAALSEDHRRIGCAIDILLDVVERKRKSELRTRAAERTKEAP